MTAPGIHILGKRSLVLLVAGLLCAPFAWGCESEKPTDERYQTELPREDEASSDDPDESGDAEPWKPPPSSAKNPRGAGGRGAGWVRGRGGRTIFYPGDIRVREPRKGDRIWSDGGYIEFRDGSWQPWRDPAEDQLVWRGGRWCRGDCLGQPNDPPTWADGEVWREPYPGQLQRDSASGDWRVFADNGGGGFDWGGWQSPAEGAVEQFEDGTWREYDGDEWSEVHPPSDGTVQWRDDEYREYRDGEWSDWQGPSDGDIEWREGRYREYSDGEWSDWQDPEDGDVELRGDQWREYEDGEWSDWRARDWRQSPDGDTETWKERDDGDIDRPELVDERFQSRLPKRRESEMEPGETDGTEPSDDERWDEKEIERAEQERQASPSACNCGGVSGGGALGSVGQAILWVLLAVVLIVVLGLIARSIKLRGGGDEDEEEEDLFDEDDAETPDDEDEEEEESELVRALKRPIPKHEKLANEGRFAEAIHAVFLTAMRDLIRRCDRPVRESLTSREVLGFVGLAGDGAEALRRLVFAVEVTRFGMRDADRELYERCIADADILAASPLAAESSREDADGLREAA